FSGYRTLPSSLSCMYSCTAVIYTLSLHDALPISLGPLHENPASPAPSSGPARSRLSTTAPCGAKPAAVHGRFRERWRQYARQMRSEEHTSELQSRENLVCRLLLEKKKTTATGKN